MSVYSKLSKARKTEVFSGRDVPKEWMPSGTWDSEYAEYLCFVSSTQWADGSYVFVCGEKRNTVRAVRL